ncbi:MAG: pyruvate kinase [Dissulfurispiraceae bacterium]|jgi:pyruvate kinase|nr:pyruvate kinase [Dissulfurispiraceae bacterium]
MRRAKIICTIGPASNNSKTIRALMLGGMDVARLNFSHGSHEDHARSAELIRSAASALRKKVSVIQDLQGIKIRVTDFPGGSIILKKDQELMLFSGTASSSDKGIFITYRRLLEDVKAGHRLLLDDGFLRLDVLGKKDRGLRAVVNEGGILRSRKGVNFPDSKISAGSFTAKDRSDLLFGLSIGVDYVAVSFVRSAGDILRIRRWAEKRGIDLPPLIAKIEKPEALENIERILDNVEGIMVARGDLGVEMPAEQVPVIQKRLIDLANKRGKLVVTATQMLESMTLRSRPTRAEATDVANAVLDGSDALMLSAETAIGKYPVEAASIMDKIIRYTEAESPRSAEPVFRASGRFSEAVADGACRAAHEVGAKAIVVFTRSGFTAQLVSKFRPGVPVFALTSDNAVLNKLPLLWGVEPMPGRFVFSSKSDSKGRAEALDAGFIKSVQRYIIKRGLAKKDDTIIFVSSSAFLGDPNIIRIQRL